jgi:ribosome-binding protein aMBF1 (putative translation factor)
MAVSTRRSASEPPSSCEFCGAVCAKPRKVRPCEYAMYACSTCARYSHKRRVAVYGRRLDALCGKGPPRE